LFQDTPTTQLLAAALAGALAPVDAAALGAAALGAAALGAVLAAGLAVAPPPQAAKKTAAAPTSATTLRLTIRELLFACRVPRCGALMRRQAITTFNPFGPPPHIMTGRAAAH
jgi:hypothetical protein